MTRLRLSPADKGVLDLVAEHLGRLRRADLAQMSRPARLDPGLDDDGKRQARRNRLNNRKTTLTAQSSSRWAGTIIRANDDQYRFARDAQRRHITGLRAAIPTIEKRLAAPTWDTLTKQEQAARRKAGLPTGYSTQSERFAKQRRVQSLRAELARATCKRDDKLVRVVVGGKRLAKARHNLDAAGLSEAGWRQRWECARWRIEANGSGDEPFGNLTITVTPEGEVSLRLPKPLEHLANTKQGRYVLSDRARFSYREDEWLARITGGKSVSYTFTRHLDRAGIYLTAAWSSPATTGQDCDVRAAGPVVAVDLNDGHLAVRRLDSHGNPVGASVRIEFSLTGLGTRRDAQVRHAISRLVNYTLTHGVDTIAIEDLDFADARQHGRETMGRGQRGKRFRRTVAGIPTAVFRHRLQAMTHHHGIRLLAVNPAYTSRWGDQHWRKPYQNVTRHEAAATVIGRRAQGHKARRREGVTRTRPEDRVVRATDQTGTSAPAATGSRHRPGMRGTESRPPRRARTRLPGRATVTPAPANNGQPQL
ncbi:hypothetical protein [Nocardia sp. IFM 10818]